MKSRGFTLIEIAIVLVIIGLLAGGILKGQQMIENSRYKAWVKEIDAYKSAIYAFKDRYGYYPGDLPSATSKLPSIAGATVANGNGNGFIDHNGTGITGEPSQAYIQLMVAGLLPGDPANPALRGTAGSWPYVPSVSGAMVGFDFLNMNEDHKIKNRVQFEAPGSFAQRYDNEFDDGKAYSGSAVCWDGLNPCTGNIYPQDVIVRIHIDF